MLHWPRRAGTRQFWYRRNQKGRPLLTPWVAESERVGQIQGQLVRIHRQAIGRIAGVLEQELGLLAADVLHHGIHLAAIAGIALLCVEAVVGAQQLPGSLTVGQADILVPEASTRRVQEDVGKAIELVLSITDVSEWIAWVLDWAEVNPEAPVRPGLERAGAARLAAPARRAGLGGSPGTLQQRFLQFGVLFPQCLFGETYQQGAERGADNGDTQIKQTLLVA